MNLVPDEELVGKKGLNLAPMVDFLFLIVAVFATLAVTRSTLFDSEINLVRIGQRDKTTPPKATEYSLIHLSVTELGQYKWVTEFHEYLMENLTAIEQELLKQEQLGLLPRDHQKTKVLLHIDKKAQWEPVMELIFTLKQHGFRISPVYEIEEAV